MGLWADGPASTSLQPHVAGAGPDEVADRSGADLGGAVGRAQRGDPDAFRLLYRDLQPRLLRYLHALAGQDAEDIASETWLHVTRDLAGFTGTYDGFRGWVATAARALDAVGTESAIALIATLPPDQAEAVLLRAVLGLDAQTAGEVLGKRAGAIRTAAHRGLRTLHKKLAAGEPELTGDGRTREINSW